MNASGPESATRIRVAAIQVVSKNGEPDENLRNAEKHVRDAVSAGATFVVGPELMTSGYIFNTSIWNSGEPAGGRTDQWLKRLSVEHGIYLGAGYLETDGEHFYDSFVLMDPRGVEVGRVRKAYAPNWEAYFYKEGNTSHVISCDLGRIGVGICFENWFSRFLRKRQIDDVDFMVMPCCAASNDPPVKLLFWNLKIREIGPFYAQKLGVPTIMSNKVGSFRTTMPLFPFFEILMKFDGASCISDPSGSVLARIEEDEGFIVSDIAFGSSKRSTKNDLETYGIFAMPTSFLHRVVFAPLPIARWLGKLYYLCSGGRRRMADAMSVQKTRSEKVG